MYSHRRTSFAHTFLFFSPLFCASSLPTSCLDLDSLLGWKRNLASLAPERARRRRFGLAWVIAYALPSPVAASGLSFETHEERVQQLQAQTRIVRLGEDPHSLENQRARENEDRWGRAAPDVLEGDEREEEEEDDEWETRRRYEDEG